MEPSINESYQCSLVSEVPEVNNQLAYFIGNLTNTSDWPARWSCGQWTEFHGWLYIFSDVMTWLAYFIIPVILVWFIRRQPNLPFLPLFWLFSAFILLCGVTHLMDAIIFWWPAYRISALLKCMTALVSVATVFGLIRDLPSLLETTTSTDEKLEFVQSGAIDKWRAMVDQKDQRIRELNATIEELRSR